MPRKQAPTGLPGEQAQAQKRREAQRRRVLSAALWAGCWLVLVALVGPSRNDAELPPLGPATHELVAGRAHVDAEPIPDLAERQEKAAAAVPIHYSLDLQAARRRIDALHDAFRLVRPRWRLYVAERARLLGAPPPGAEPAAAGKASTVATTDKVVTPVRQAEVAQLDASIAEEMARLRPEFEALVAVRRSELATGAFDALQQAGFAEELELLLTDAAQILLTERIVRDRERFEDDLLRGVIDALPAGAAGPDVAAAAPDARFDAASSRAKVLDVDDALRRADELVAEFVRQKKPSRLDEPVLQAVLKSMVRAMVEPTWTRDLDATRKAEEAAREAVPKTRTVHIARGQPLVRRGELVTPELQARLARIWGDSPVKPTPLSYAASGLLLAIALGAFGAFARLHLHHFRHRPQDAALLGAILLVHAGVMRALLEVGAHLLASTRAVTAPMWLTALPFALGPGLATLFVKPITAAPFALLCAVVSGLMIHNSALAKDGTGASELATVLAVVVGFAGIHAARRLRQRADLVRGALGLSGIALLCALAVTLFTAPAGALLFDVPTGLMLMAGLASGLITYLLLSALTPVLETAFNRLTDIRLVELASMNHPALRLLATEAPGTFTHSVMVGNLAQAGCEAIGASGLLARVGAYYHDLGKTRAARYFAENQAGENPHDRIKPHLSALIIKAHVKDGIKILRDFKLPDEIIDFVPQHHGTSLIAHFYHRAMREAQEHGEEVNEADFRYPGPKPQRKETALLMLADSVEAAAKALPDPNPVRIAALVKKIIAGKLEDGQFEECDLTLRELGLVEQAFVRTLVGMHHTRPTYLPSPKQAQTGAQPSVQPPPQSGPTDEVRRLAVLADGGVGTPQGQVQVQGPGPVQAQAQGQTPRAPASEQTPDARPAQRKVG